MPRSKGPDLLRMALYSMLTDRVDIPEYDGIGIKLPKTCEELLIVIYLLENMPILLMTLNPRKE